VAYETIKVLIWGKTYPELSAKYVETVCTGGVRENGCPIRLYPVPLRYLANGQQYRLYDWIEVPLEKSQSDPRPESYKVSADRITLVGHIDPDAQNWRARRQAIFRDSTWQFGSIEALKAAQKANRRSMGIVSPGKIEDVRLVMKPESDRREYEEKMGEIQNQGDMFRVEYKELEYLPQDIKLRWRCAEKCAECSNSPHDMKALDWGLLELARREGWEKARLRLEEISQLGAYDFRLFMGNFRLHPHIFGIIGMWYPKLATQTILL
jgi:hypothetical protein